MEPHPPEAPLDPRVWRIAAVVLFGPLMSALDTTVVNVSMDTLSRGLQAPLTVVQWVTSAYLLTLALTLPLSGWLVDRVGARRVYLGSFLAFTLTSLGCGLAPSVDWLIFMRALQGVAGGLLAPMAQMMIARAAGRHMARVMGFLVVPMMLGPILGPVLAGVILQHASWRWIFWINLPIGLVATALAATILPREEEALHPRRFDLAGFLLLSLGLSGLLVALESAGNAPALPGSRLSDVLGALVLLAAFLWHARRAGSESLIDLRLFARPTFAAAASTQFLSNAMIYGGQMLVPLYLLTLRAMTPAQTGVLTAATGIGMMCSYPWMGSLTERFGPRRVSSSGVVLALLGTLPLASPHLAVLPIPLLAAGLFLRGIGLGCINIPSMSAAYADVPREQIPTATTAINIVQRLGGPIGTCLLALYLHAHLAAGAESAFAASFALLCGLMTVNLAAALRLPRTL